MVKGTVKFFGTKGYGFITGEDGNDYFVHFTDILAEGFKTLTADQKVEFEPAQGEKGKKATKVTIIG